MPRNLIPHLFDLSPRIRILRPHLVHVSPLLCLFHRLPGELRRRRRRCHSLGLSVRRPIVALDRLRPGAVALLGEHPVGGRVRLRLRAPGGNHQRPSPLMCITLARLSSSPPQASDDGAAWTTLNDVVAFPGATTQVAARPRTSTHSRGLQRQGGEPQVPDGLSRQLRSAV